MFSEDRNNFPIFDRDQFIGTIKNEEVLSIYNQILELIVLEKSWFLWKFLDNSLSIRSQNDVS